MTKTQTGPQHIAIIMDGNGRWAEARGRNRIFGHIKGARVAKKIVEFSVEKRIKALTLYAFSEENWGRPVEEVNFLMKLLYRYVSRERKNLLKNNIRFRCIGQLEKIPEEVRRIVEETMKITKENTGMILTFALSYGGRQEITQVIRNIAELAYKRKISPDDINENLVSGLLQTAPLKDPDLLIRTSGEYRLSNFLTWQTVYTELYFADILWPDFKIEDYNQALESYCQRERRFGKIKIEPLPPLNNYTDHV